MRRATAQESLCKKQIRLFLFLKSACMAENCLCPQSSNFLSTLEALSELYKLLFFLTPPIRLQALHLSKSTESSPTESGAGVCHRDTLAF